MLCGGSSSGKTSVVRALKAHLLQSTDWNIGEVELEERKEKTWRGVMEAVLGMPWASATTEERREAWDKTYGTERIFTLDHRSQYGKGQSIVAKFKHLCYAKGCKAIFLDHVTLAVNEFGDGQGNSAQDQMMNEFLEFTETTGCHLFLISHLRKTGLGAKSFEEGAIPTMDSLKGSGSLKQISFNIIGVSRNLQDPDDYERNCPQLHVLKSRETGDTGPADRLHWNNDTRSLEPARPRADEDTGDF
jgi:twinkle protein